MPITELLKEHYSISEAKIATLEGYDSMNFKISCPAATYVLKQYKNNKGNKELILAENEILS
ncbi:MAG: hypothetical protein KJN76_10345, partial [Eudoraea sp.]|nr:hypothetical protein [Eudoraea sp.]